MESGPGLRDSADGESLLLVDRGEACLFSDLTGTDKKLRLYTTVAGDAGETVLLQGYDENGDWIRTQIGSTWTDGEQVTLTATYVETTNFFSSLMAAQKPETSGNVKVWERDTTKSTERLVGEWEPTETRPRYRRSLIPGLSTTNTGNVTVVGKLRYIPAKVDTDWLLIPSVPALKLMVMAVRKEENNLIEEAEGYEFKAVRVLNELLHQYLGDGMVPVPRIQSTAFGGGEVQNMQ